MPSFYDSICDHEARVRAGDDRALRQRRHHDAKAAADAVADHIKRAAPISSGRGSFFLWVPFAARLAPDDFSALRIAQIGAFVKPARGRRRFGTVTKKGARRKTAAAPFLGVGSARRKLERLVRAFDVVEDKTSATVRPSQDFAVRPGFGWSERQRSRLSPSGYGTLPITSATPCGWRGVSLRPSISPRSIAFTVPSGLIRSARSLVM